MKLNATNNIYSKYKLLLEVKQLTAKYFLFLPFYCVIRSLSPTLLVSCQPSVVEIYNGPQGEDDIKFEFKKVAGKSVSWSNDT